MWIVYVLGAVGTVTFDRWSAGTVRGDWSTSLVFGALWPLTWALAVGQGAVISRAARRAEAELGASCPDLAGFFAGRLSSWRHRAFCEHLRFCDSCRRSLCTHADGEAGLSEGARGVEEHGSPPRRWGRRSNP